MIQKVSFFIQSSHEVDPLNEILQAFKTSALADALSFVPVQDVKDLDLVMADHPETHQRIGVMVEPMEKIENEKDMLQSQAQLIQDFENEFEELHAQFFDLQEKYDQLLTQNQHLLWEYIPTHVEAFTHFPAIQHDLIESEDQIGPYTIQEDLGQGQYATVFACQYTLDLCLDEIQTTGPQKPTLAVKVIDKTKRHGLEQLERVALELEALADAKLHHPGLLHLHEVFHTNRYIYFVTERGGKDLFDYFEEHANGVEENIPEQLLHLLLPAIQHLHQQGYAHRDLKPENLLWTHDQQEIKIIDFGLCAKIPRDKKLRSFCGSPGFFAPEVLSPSIYNGEKADMWSIACIVLELVMGHALFLSAWLPAYDLELLQDPPAFEIRLTKAVSKVHHLFLHHPTLSGYSSAFKDMLLSLLVINPDDRSSCLDILQHPWYNPMTSSPYLNAPTSVVIVKDERQDARSKLMSSPLMSSPLTSHLRPLSSEERPTRVITANGGGVQDDSMFFPHTSSLKSPRQLPALDRTDVQKNIKVGKPLLSSNRRKVVIAADRI